MLDRNVKSNDPTWTIAPVFVWSCVEPFIGIVCACLPTFAPFFRRWWAVRRTTGKSTDPETGAGKSGSGAHHLASKDTFRMSRNKKEWTRMHGDPDDEVNLTNHISGPATTRSKGGSSDDLAYPMTSISVKQDVDVAWEAIDRQ